MKHILILFLIISSFEISAQDQILRVESSIGGQGGTIYVFAEQVDSIVNLQFSLGFDPSKIRIKNTDLFSDGDTPFDNNSIVINSTPEFVAFFWSSPTLSPTSAQEQLLFELDFDFLGAPCDTTYAYISDIPTEVEIVKFDDSVIRSGVIRKDAALVYGGSSINIYSGFCNATSGAEDGSLWFYPCGGSGTYTWSLNAVAQGQLIDGERVHLPDLPIGEYLIKIEDEVGLIIEKAIQIDLGNSLQIDLGITEPNCFLQNNGRLNIMSIEGGSQPYTSRWSTGEVNKNTIRDLSNGIYSLSVTDNTGCSQIASAELHIDTLKLSAEIVDSIGCNGTPGTLLITASGGAPYPGDLYEYNNFFASTPDAKVTTIDEKVFVSVKDANNCSIVDSFLLPTANGVYLNNCTAVDAVDELDNGSILFDYGGTSQEVSLFWSSMDTSRIEYLTEGFFEISGLPPNRYSIFLIDVNGCSDTCTVEVGVELINSTNSIQEGRVQIYPNPVQDFIQFKEVDFKASLSIFDQVGVLRIQSSDSKVDVSSLESGIYFVRGQDYVGRFVKL